MTLDLPFPPTPGNAPRFAAIAVDAALGVGNLVLDYAPSSLATLEAFLDAHGSDRKESVVLPFGCYVGEVLVRAGRGQWRATEETPLRGLEGVPLVLDLGNGDYCNPLGRVRKYCESPDAGSLVRFWEAFRLSAAPPRPWWRRLFGR